MATTSALARKPCVRTHYVRNNNAKFCGHFVCPRTETVREHALRSHQNLVGNNVCQALPVMEGLGNNIFQ